MKRSIIIISMLLLVSGMRAQNQYSSYSPTVTTDGTYHSINSYHSADGTSAYTSPRGRAGVVAPYSTQPNRRSMNTDGVISNYSASISEVGQAQPKSLWGMATLGENNTTGDEGSAGLPPDDDDNYDPNNPPFGALPDGVLFLIFLATMAAAWITLKQYKKKRRLSLNN